MNILDIKEYIIDFTSYVYYKLLVNKTAARGNDMNLRFWTQLVEVYKIINKDPGSEVPLNFKYVVDLYNFDDESSMVIETRIWGKDYPLTSEVGSKLFGLGFTIENGQYIFNCAEHSRKVYYLEIQQRANRKNSKQWYVEEVRKGIHDFHDVNGMPSGIIEVKYCYDSAIEEIVKTFEAENWNISYETTDNTTKFTLWRDGF